MIAQFGLGLSINVAILFSVAPAVLLWQVFDSCALDGFKKHPSTSLIRKCQHVCMVLIQAEVLSLLGGLGSTPAFSSVQNLLEIFFWVHGTIFIVYLLKMIWFLHKKV